LSALGQVEGVAHVLRQATTAQTTPSLDSPAYAVLRRAREYEVRRYEPYAVAEVGMPAAAAPASGAPHSAAAAHRGADCGYVMQVLMLRRTAGAMGQA
jgi:hypothetical protein